MRKTDRKSGQENADPKETGHEKPLELVWRPHEMPNWFVCSLYVAVYYVMSCLRLDPRKVVVVLLVLESGF